MVDFVQQLVGPITWKWGTAVKVNTLLNNGQVDSSATHINRY